MNRNLIEAIYDIEKIESLMIAIEKTYLDIQPLPGDVELYDAGVNAFYALWDAIHKLREDLQRLSGDELVVDAIYAVNDVRRRKN